jgi:hypothetical protein
MVIVASAVPPALAMTKLAMTNLAMTEMITETTTLMHRVCSAGALLGSNATNGRRSYVIDFQERVDRKPNCMIDMPDQRLK